MRWLLGILTSLFIAIPSMATTIDLLDLNIPTSRVPTWYPFDETVYIETRSWTEYDVTCANAPCASGKAGYKDMAGNPLVACTAVTTTNFLGMDCMVDAAIDDSVLYIPAGTYNLDAGEQMTVTRSDIIIRGAGWDDTIITVNHSQRAAFAGCKSTEVRATHLSICKPNGEGVEVDWIAGYSRGEDTVTLSDVSGFSVAEDGYVRLDMAVTTACDHLDTIQGATGVFSHIAKVESINVPGSQITITQPLRFDYDDPGCSGWVAYPWTPLYNVGVEKLRLTSSLPHCGNVSSPGSCAADTARYFSFGISTIVNSWLVDVKLDHAWERWLMTEYVGPGYWLQGNWFDDLSEAIVDNTEGMCNWRGSTDLVWENNICTNSKVCQHYFNGAQGIVSAYNYFRQDECQSSYFTHGKFTRENLIEGNDVDCGIWVADAWWGRSGPRITAYRNRQISNECTGYPEWGILSDDSCCNGSVTPAPWNAEYVNIIGNTAAVYSARPTYAGGQGDCPDLGDENTLENTINYLWIENNAYRHIQIDDGAFRVGGANDRSCGVEENDPCPGTNKNVSKPDATWVGDYPVSLYHTEPPSWWCENACPWEDSGIGAFGDDFTDPDNLCKLPAQIRYDGDICYAVSPKVAGVYVSSSSWHADYLSAIQANGFSNSATLGYQLKDGVDQMVNTIPGVEIDQISIKFTKDIDDSADKLEAGSLTVDMEYWHPSPAGWYTETEYRIEISGVSYDDVNYVATWTINPTPWSLLNYVGFGNAGVRLTLNDGIISDVGGIKLDGYWENEVSEFPSGKNIPGEHENFVFNFRVHPGDTSPCVNDGMSRYNDPFLAVDDALEKCRQAEGTGTCNDVVYPYDTYDCNSSTACSFDIDLNGSKTINDTDWGACLIYISNVATPCGPGIVGGCGVSE